MTQDAEAEKIVWQGRFITAKTRGKWEYVSRARGIKAAVILAVEDGHVLLVEQYREPLGAPCLELPAGLVGDERAGEVVEAAAARELRTAVKTHIKAISEKYIIEGETADGALMFLPSEAVYAELHANFPELVREGFTARVWIVSPTTCMATLNTMRAILKDARMREQAGAIRTTLRLLHRDVELVAERVDKLNTHFGQARADLEGISTAAERAGKRAAKLDNFDFEELAPASDSLPQLGPEAAE